MTNLYQSSFKFWTSESTGVCGPRPDSVLWQGEPFLLESALAHVSITDNLPRLQARLHCHGCTNPASEYPHALSSKPRVRIFESKSAFIHKPSWQKHRRGKLSFIHVTRVSRTHLHFIYAFSILCPLILQVASSPTKPTATLAYNEAVDRTYISLPLAT